MDKKAKGEQIEYTEENNEETIKQIKEAYTSGAVEQGKVNEEKYED